MGCCNLLNYVYILVREKKRKEIRNKTHAHHTYSRTPAVLLHDPAAGLLPHDCAIVCMHYERRCGAAARAHHRLAALLPSACMRPVYLSEREPRALWTCAAACCPHTRAAALPSAAPPNLLTDPLPCPFPCCVGRVRASLWCVLALLLSCLSRCVLPLCRWLACLALLPLPATRTGLRRTAVSLTAKTKSSRSTLPDPLCLPCVPDYKGHHVDGTQRASSPWLRTTGQRFLPHSRPLKLN
jgi:hypothetical protein